jgi:hypothetical protein
MNIFVTSINTLTCAQEHCDVHLRKMIVETAQLLSTAHFELDKVQVGYKPTHKNHPCAVWVREHPANYRWAVTLLGELLDEYSYRFDKTHKTQEVYGNLSRPPNFKYIYTQNATPSNFVTAMPDVFISKDVETSYKGYLNEKFKEWRSRERPMKVEWTSRPTPSWVSL